MLDSVWAYDVRKPKAPAVRFVALGRDFEAENAGEDNEPTGVHVSDGDPSVHGLLGKSIDPDDSRVFFTEQHGENIVWEVIGSHH